MNNPDAYNATNGPAVTNLSEPLYTSITEAAAACKQYRGYIASQYNEGFAEGYTSYMLNQQDLNTLLQDGTLDGIRIYIGHEDKGNGPLVRLYVVGCKQAQDGTYQDVIDEQQEARLTSGRPCPSECGGKNVLNS
jgi:hypothetical protein